MSLTTKLFGSTRFSGIVPLQVPIVSAPMAGAAGGILAAAVTRGGGLGFCGAGMWDADTLRSEVQLARSALPATGGSGERLPIGAGLLVWRLAQLTGDSLPSPGEEPETSKAHALVHALAQEHLASAWFSFGSFDHTEAWIRCLRHWDAQFNERIRIIIGIGTAAEAEDALRLEPDALAVTGNEGGGHGVSASPGVAELLQQVNALVAPLGQNAPLLFAAGGLANGADAAQLLRQGADGVVYGTRYLLTPEATYSRTQKHLLLNAGSSTDVVQGQNEGGDGPTTRSYAYDYARGTTSWPPGVDGRGLRSKLVRQFDPEHPEQLKEVYDARDPEHVVTWAGTGVDRMDDLVPATELTERLAREIVAANV